jgi:Rieske Fe-S protein
MLATGWTGCSPATYNVYKTPVTEGRLQVPQTVFDKGPLQFVRPSGWYYDIAVSRQPDGSYLAMLLQCTHQENQLNVSGDGYSCSLHGSRFDKNGQVLHGPAEVPLQRYKTSVENNNLVIHLT